MRRLFMFLLMWAYFLMSLSVVQLLNKFYESGSHIYWNSLSPILKSQIIPSLVIMIGLEILSPILIKLLSKIFKNKK